MKVVLFASLILMGLSWPLMWVSAKASAGTWPGSDEEKKLDAACSCTTSGIPEVVQGIPAVNRYTTDVLRNINPFLYGRRELSVAESI